MPPPEIALDAGATEHLVASASSGDRDAFDRLVHAFHPRVYRWALALTGDPDEADDVAQEVFVVLLRRLHQFREEAEFPVWLHRITSRVASQTRRTKGRRARLAATPRAAPERIVYETDPGGRVDRERLAVLVRALWTALPERQRVVVDLVDLQGYAPAAVAAMLEINPATVRANLFKGRRSLRRRMLEHAARFPDVDRGGR